MVELSCGGLLVLAARSSVQVFLYMRGNTNVGLKPMPCREDMRQTEVLTDAGRWDLAPCDVASLHLLSLIAGRKDGQIQAKRTKRDNEGI